MDTEMTARAVPDKNKKRAVHPMAHYDERSKNMSPKERAKLPHYDEKGRPKGKKKKSFQEAYMERYGKDAHDRVMNRR